MSRKTEEIKLRVTTLEKGWWQEAAVSENTSLSELIRRVMNERVNQRPLDIGSFTINGIDAVAWASAPVGDEGPEVDVDLRGTDGFSPRKPLPPASPPPAAPQPDRVRRETSCSCGKPPWLYCGGCDV